VTLSIPSERGMGFPIDEYVMYPMNYEGLVLKLPQASFYYCWLPNFSSPKDYE
jgi:hypothetical protein